MFVIDVEKQGGSVLLLHERGFEEFYQVSLPPKMSSSARKRACHDLEQAGFQSEYKFRRQVLNPSTASLAKAQAAAISKRILNKTGIAMSMGHLICLK